jgi:hypothetical protein
LAQRWPYGRQFQSGADGRLPLGCRRDGGEQLDHVNAAAPMSQMTYGE